MNTNILIINITVAAKYRDFDIAVRSNVERCVSCALSVPFNFVVDYSADCTNPWIRLHGNKRRIGPVTETKINSSVRQGLAITRNQCPGIGHG